MNFKKLYSSVGFWIAISWGATLLCILAFLYFIISAFSAGHHQTTPIAPYAGYATLTSILTGVVCLFTTVMITFSRTSEAVRNTKISLVLIGIGIVCITIVLRVTVAPVPEFITQYLGHKPYNVHRTYTNKIENFPSDNSRVSLRVCKGTLSGYISREIKGCKGTDSILLFEAGFQDIFNFKYNTDNWDVGREGSKIIYTIKLARISKKHFTTKDKQVFIGVNRYPNQGGGHHVELSQNEDVLRWADCSKYFCKIYSRTERGWLRYAYKRDALDYDPQAWGKFEEKIFKLLDSWQTK